ncbi:MAG: hypothetical protein AAF497_09590, partial [Planctomycetota bacterium]
MLDAIRPFALFLLISSCAFAQSNENRVVLKDIASMKVFNAAHPNSVEAEATITYVDPLWNFFFLQEGERAIFAFGKSLPIYSVGKKVRLLGKLVTGDLNPIIQVDSYEILGEGTSPDAVRADLGDMKYGDLDCRYVTATGIVRQVILGSEDAVLHCQVIDSDVLFLIRVTQQRGLDWNPQGLIGKRVECDGCLGLELEVPPFTSPGGPPRRIGAFKVFCSSVNKIRLLEDSAATDNPTMPLGELTQRVSNGSRFVTHGQVRLVSPDENPPALVVYDDSTPLKLNVVSTKNILPGMVLRIGGTRSEDA